MSFHILVVGYLDERIPYMNAQIREIQTDDYLDHMFDRDNECKKYWSIRNDMHGRQGRRVIAAIDRALGRMALNGIVDEGLDQAIDVGCLSRQKIFVHHLTRFLELAKKYPDAYFIIEDELKDSNHNPDPNDGHSLDERKDDPSIEDIDAILAQCLADEQANIFERLRFCVIIFLVMQSLATYLDIRSSHTTPLSGEVLILITIYLTVMSNFWRRAIRLTYNPNPRKNKNAYLFLIISTLSIYSIIAVIKHYDNDFFKSRRCKKQYAMNKTSAFICPG